MLLKGRCIEQISHRSNTHIFLGGVSMESAQRLNFVHARYTGRDNSTAEFKLRWWVRGGAVKFLKPLTAFNQRQYYKYSPTTALSYWHVSTEVMNKHNLKNISCIEIITFLKRKPNFSLRDRMRNAAKVVEEHCWAITQAVDDHSAADQVQVCCSPDCSWTPL
jgi:hypothetical protein